MKISPLVLATALLLSHAPGGAQEDLSDPTHVKAVYDQMCAGCHGFRGDGGEGHRGGFSPHIGTLALKDYMDSVPDDYIAMIIRKGGVYMGKMATMPAWEKRLTEEEILGLVKHIRAFTQSGNAGAKH